MMNRGLILGTTLLATMTAGCAELPSELDDGLDFRVRENSASSAFWVASPNNPGDGDVEVHEGDDDDVPDAILWDIDGAEVLGQIEPGVFATRLIVEQNALFEVDAASLAAPAPTCWVEATDHPSGEVYALVSADDDVVFTLWRRFVLSGDVALPERPRIKQSPALRSQLAVSFKAAQIYAGSPWDGEQVATADATVARANPVRRLLLAALVAGECGSAGLP